MNPINEGTVEDLLQEIYSKDDVNSTMSDKAPEKFRTPSIPSKYSEKMKNKNEKKLKYLAQLVAETSLLIQKVANLCDKITERALERKKEETKIRTK